MELNDPSWTIFRAVQQLIQLADLGSRQEKLRRIWEPTYTLVDHIMFKMLSVSGEKLSLLEADLLLTHYDIFLTCDRTWGP